MVLLTLFEADYFTTYLRHVGVIYDYISISNSLGTLGQYTCLQANFSSRIRILGFRKPSKSSPRYRSTSSSRTPRTSATFTLILKFQEYQNNTHIYGLIFQTESKFDTFRGIRNHLEDQGPHREQHTRSSSFFDSIRMIHV